MRSERCYRLDALLEKGRFGAMYRGVDLRAPSQHRATVGIWVFRPELANHKVLLAALRRDIESVRDLRHPNIAPVLDVGSFGTRLFFTTDLGGGDTLRNVLDALGSETLPLREGDQIVAALGSALAYAHERGLVHGDVRAENTIVTAEHSVKLANLALARLARSASFGRTHEADTRGLATIAHEVYTGALPNLSSLAASSGALPKRRRKAIVAALAAPPGEVSSVARFLHDARLEQRASASTSIPLRRGPRLSPWRLLLPVNVRHELALRRRREPSDGQPEALAAVPPHSAESRGRATLGAKSAAARENDGVMKADSERSGDTTHGIEALRRNAASALRCDDDCSDID